MKRALLLVPPNRSFHSVSATSTSRLVIAARSPVLLGKLRAPWTGNTTVGACRWASTIPEVVNSNSNNDDNTPVSAETSHPDVDFLSSSSDLSALQGLTTPSPSLEDFEWYHPSGYVMDLCTLVHDMTGWPYALSIAGITVGFRLLVHLPLGIVAAKVDPNLDHDLQVLTNRVQRTKDPSQRIPLTIERDKMQARVKRRQRIQLALPLFNLGTFFVMVSGMRSLTVYYPHEMAMGGISWFPDLTQADPTLFLPLVSAGTVFLMGELRADQMGNPLTKELTPRWLLARRSLPFFFFLILHKAPTAIFCYWIPNSVLSLAQTGLLAQPTVRAALGVKNANEKKETAIEYVEDLERQQQATSNISSSNQQQQTSSKMNHSKTPSIKKKKKRKGKR